MASNLIIFCESVIILSFHLVEIFQDHTMNKNVLKFNAFT